MGRRRRWRQARGAARIQQGRRRGMVLGVEREEPGVGAGRGRRQEPQAEGGDQRQGDRHAHRPLQRLQHDSRHLLDKGSTAMKLVAATAALTGMLFAAPGFADEALAKKHNCTACHAIDKKLVGPAYKDVAAKYKGQNVAAKLQEKVKKGGQGVWGPVP